MTGIDDLTEARAISRMLATDHTLWAEDPTEISNRLGWLTEPAAMRANVGELERFVEIVASRGVDRVVWCGMGGSSLFPELLANAPITSAEAPPFTVVDSSHPEAVLRAHAFAEAGRPLFVIASKSGGTIETRSHLEYFLEHFAGRAEFACVTDAGSALDANARTHGFVGVFNANPNIGGRFSALSHFGLVAAALLGVDLDDLLAGAIEMLDACSADSATNPAVVLGSLMGAMARGGHDKLVLDCDASFAAWLEQLIAESTGKHGTGILPVPGTAIDAAGPDRYRVSYGAGGDLDLGAAHVTESARHLGGEIMRWEMATALSGAMLGINPFDQPDVEAAKIAAGAALEGAAVAIETVALDDALADLDAVSYLTLQAFVDPLGPIGTAIESSRAELRDRTGRVVTGAVGPRYLHSTGQLHKGGSHSGLSLQMLDSDIRPLAIPGRPFGFDDLLRAQAAGDHQALRAAGQRVHRVRSWA